MTTTLQLPTYWRGERLDAADLRDLESFHELLRDYYDIPTNEPVFPAAKQPQSERQPRTNTARATGRNSSAHPWRNTL
jgi:hypothetical protein